MSERPPEEGEPHKPYRLDPDRAAAQTGRAGEPGPGRPPRTPPPMIDTRRYRIAIGVFGLTLLIAFSVYMFTVRGIQTAGVAPGKQLHYFVAPLATSDLTGDANVNPHCNPAHPNLEALNVCGRQPLVLGLFVTGSSACTHEIDTIQAVSSQFPPGRVQFAAVAVDASRTTTQGLVRRHHWTIPVAYDPDGAVGALYGVAVCPMVEVAYRGGIVAYRLIGDDWLHPTALASKVRAMLANQT